MIKVSESGQLFSRHAEQGHLAYRQGCVVTGAYRSTLKARSCSGNSSPHWGRTLSSQIRAFRLRASALLKCPHDENLFRMGDPPK